MCILCSHMCVYVGVCVTICGHMCSSVPRLLFREPPLSLSYSYLSYKSPFAITVIVVTKGAMCVAWQSPPGEPSLRPVRMCCVILGRLGLCSSHLTAAENWFEVNPNLLFLIFIYLLSLLFVLCISVRTNWTELIFHAIFTTYSCVFFRLYLLLPHLPNSRWR